mgnify:FL=1
MKYYLIPIELAERLNLVEYRQGDRTHGYIVTAGDLSAISIDTAISAGAKEITHKEAQIIMAQIN